MARFIGRLLGDAPTEQPAVSLRVQTSLQGVPVPILLCGANRVAGNLIDYTDFTASNSSQSGGGKGGVTGAGGKGNDGQYQYTATFLLGLAEGPLQGIGNVWDGGSLTTAYTQDGAFLDGAYDQQPWPYLEADEPSHALAYRGLAYVAFQNYILGASPALPSLTFELISSNNLSLGTLDGDLTIGAYDFLTNQYWGVGFPSNLIASFSAWQGYCLANGLVGSPVLASTVTGASFLTDLMTATNSAACWLGDKFSVVPYGDSGAISGGLTIQAETDFVPSPSADPGDPVPAPTVVISFPWQYVQDEGVVYTGSAAPLENVSPYLPTGPGTYSMNGQGTYFFSVADEGQEITISYQRAATASYTPANTPVVNLTSDNFLPYQGGLGSIGAPNLPVVIVRKPRDQMINDLKVEYLDRNNAYNPVEVEVLDEASITAFGHRRPSDIRQLHFFCTPAAAQQSAALQLIREQVARTFGFTLGPQFILLDLMDIVTLTEPGLGLNAQPVRIIEIQENDDRSLTFTAEEFLGTVTAPAFNIQASQGTLKNFNADPGPVNPPVIFEPTDALGDGLEIWAAISGQQSNWGGCFIWASFDNQTYQLIGQQQGPARMGALAARLAAVAEAATGPTIDTTHTLAVNLAESAARLASAASLTSATNGDTKCVIGGGAGVAEIVAYQTATLTAKYNYDLTTLVRGAYDSAISAWPSGTPFARLDNGIFKYAYDQSRIGQTLYLKFQSYNTTQGGLQSLADVGVVSYAITGAALASPPPNVANFRTAYVDSVVNLQWDEVVDFRTCFYEIRQGASWASALKIGTVAHPPFAVSGDGTYWIAAVTQPVANLFAYSQTPASLTVTGALLTVNSLVSWDEAGTGWSGEFSGNVGVTGAVISTGVGGANQSGTYEIPIAHWVDAGRVVAAQINMILNAAGAPVGQNILSLTDFLGQPDILGSASAGLVSVYPEIAMAQNNPSDIYTAGDVYVAPFDAYGKTFDWGPWQKFSPGAYLGRGFKFRLALNIVSPLTAAIVSAFKFTVSIPNRFDHFNNVAIASTGTTLTFAPDGAGSPASFNGGPNGSATPLISVTILNAQAGDYMTYSGLTTSGVTIEIMNAGSGVARNCNVVAEGW